jgi:hypothetical protein
VALALAKEYSQKDFYLGVGVWCVDDVISMITSAALGKRIQGSLEPMANGWKSML